MICGLHDRTGFTTPGGCGGEVEPAAVYRCADCTTPFHRGCALRHFTDDSSAREQHWRETQAATLRASAELLAIGRQLARALCGFARGHDDGCGCPACSALRRFARLEAL